MKKGFSLIELLVVISIIGMLVAVAYSNFVGARERARDTRRKNDIRQIQKALELYKQDQDPPAYVATLPSCNTEWTVSGTTYMQKLPCDPSTGGSYSYERGADNLTYTLYACLENKSDPDGVTVGAGVCSSTKKYEVTEP